MKPLFHRTQVVWNWTSFLPVLSCNQGSSNCTKGEPHLTLCSSNEPWCSIPGISQQISATFSMTYFSFKLILTWDKPPQSANLPPTHPWKADSNTARTFKQGVADSWFLGYSSLLHRTLLLQKTALRSYRIKEQGFSFCEGWKISAVTRTTVTLSHFLWGSTAAENGCGQWSALFLWWSTSIPALLPGGHVTAGHLPDASYFGHVSILWLGIFQIVFCIIVACLSWYGLV